MVPLVLEKKALPRGQVIGGRFQDAPVRVQPVRATVEREAGLRRQRAACSSSSSTAPTNSSVSTLGKSVSGETSKSRPGREPDRPRRRAALRATPLARSLRSGVVAPGPAFSRRAPSAPRGARPRRRPPASPPSGARAASPWLRTPRWFALAGVRPERRRPDNLVGLALVRSSWRQRQSCGAAAGAGCGATRVA